MISLKGNKRHASILEIFQKSPLFHFTNIPSMLVPSFSFPDVNGALSPTVRTALVDAITTFRITKVTTFTHKTFSIIIDAALDICLPILSKAKNQQ